MFSDVCLDLFGRKWGGGGGQARVLRDPLGKALTL